MQLDATWKRGNFSGIELYEDAQLLRKFKILNRDVTGWRFSKFL